VPSFAECLSLGKDFFVEYISVLRVLLSVNAVITESRTLPSARQKALGKEPNSGSEGLVENNISTCGYFGTASGNNNISTGGSLNATARGNVISTCSFLNKPPVKILFHTSGLFK
jgi:hypothetical protein